MAGRSQCAHNGFCFIAGIDVLSDSLPPGEHKENAWYIFMFIVNLIVLGH